MAKILYFGKLQDLTGTPAEDLSLPMEVDTTSKLRAFLDARFKGAGTLNGSSIRIAVNNELVTEPCPIQASDEIAFLPPVGGG